jgi:thioredoxin 1
MNAITQVTSATFPLEVKAASLPVLIDFYADWCGPCRVLAPTLERLASEFNGQVKVVKVDVDQEPELAEQYQVHSIPMLAVVHQGELIGQHSGAAPESALRAAMREIAAYAQTLRDQANSNPIY